MCSCGRNSCAGEKSVKVVLAVVVRSMVVSKFVALKEKIMLNQVNVKVEVVMVERSVVA